MNFTCTFNQLRPYLNTSMEVMMYGTSAFFEITELQMKSSSKRICYDGPHINRYSDKVNIVDSLMKIRNILMLGNYSDKTISLVVWQMSIWLCKCLTYSIEKWPIRFSCV